MTPHVEQFLSFLFFKAKIHGRLDGFEILGVKPIYKVQLQFCLQFYTDKNIEDQASDIPYQQVSFVYRTVVSNRPNLQWQIVCPPCAYQLAFSSFLEPSVNDASIIATCPPYLATVCPPDSPMTIRQIGRCTGGV